MDQRFSAVDQRLDTMNQRIDTAIDSLADLRRDFVTHPHET